MAGIGERARKASPPRLERSTPPSGTEKLAIEMLDPDAPGGIFTRWLVYGVPPGIRRPGGAAGRRGYGGPCT